MSRPPPRSPLPWMSDSVVNALQAVNSYSSRALQVPLVYPKRGRRKVLSAATYSSSDHTLYVQRKPQGTCPDYQYTKYRDKMRDTEEESLQHQLDALALLGTPFLHQGDSMSASWVHTLPPSVLAENKANAQKKGKLYAASGPYFFSTTRPRNDDDEQDSSDF